MDVYRDDMMAVVLERIEVVCNWNAAMAVHFEHIGFESGMPGLYGT